MADNQTYPEDTRMGTLTCPKGHKLPNAISGMQCGMSWCASEPLVTNYKPTTHRQSRQEKYKNATQKGPAKSAMAEIKAELATTQPETGLGDVVEDKAYLEKMEKNIGRYAARKAFAKLPKDLTPETIRKFIEKKLETLLPAAIERVEYDLKLGDDDVSRKMALEVLDRTGFGRKDNNVMPGAPIIIVQSGTGGQTYKPAFLVDGEVVDK